MTRLNARRGSTCALAMLLLGPSMTGRAVAAPAATASAASSLPARPDQALVHVIRPADPGGGDMVADYFFAGEQLLAVTKGKTHGAAYLPPGKHLLWCQGGAALLELVPGQTYYIVCGFFHGFSLVDEAEGSELLAATKPGPEVGPKQQEKARNRREKFYPMFHKAITDEAYPQPPPPPRPADTAGMLRVPAYSPVEVELMENVSSSVTPAGERVRFRVVSAGPAGDRAWIAPGTEADGVVTAAQSARRAGASGLLAVDLLSLPVAQGIPLALMGQVVGTAKSRAKAASVAFAFGGLIGASLVHGREMFYLAGERFTFWTRDEVWLAPVGEAPPETPADESPTLAAKLVGDLTVSMVKFEVPPTLAIHIEDADAESRVDLVSVGDWQLPEPVTATQLAQTDGGWTASFGGWSLLRHLRPMPKGIDVGFRVTRPDGEVRNAEALIAWKMVP